MTRRPADGRTSPRLGPTGRAGEIARDLLDFVDASPSPYHAVHEARTRLEAAGFASLDEGDDWRLEPGRGYFTTRAGASLVAFRLGTTPPAETGFRIVGAHTDSPTLRLKPRPSKPSAGYLTLDVEVYGSPILATWTDRDLSIAGRVVVDGPGRQVPRLVRIDRPLCRIPNLAIHLDRAVNDDGLKLDRHRHLSPALAVLPAGDELGGAVTAALAAACEVEPGRVRGHDLCLYDVAEGTFGGLANEFLWAARLDDLAMCHAALRALLAFAADSLRTAPVTAVAALFDHEEVGSQSAQGAGGAYLRDTLARVCEAHPGAGGLPRALARTVLASADMAHAVHPNRAEKHDPPHSPYLNGGPVVKTNAGQRYATDGETGALFRRLCRAEGVPCQEFVTIADLASGSTIGPI